MAYSNLNYLLRVKEICDIHQEHYATGLPTVRIWELHIYPRYFISLSTLWNYLSIPAERLLKDIEEASRK